MIARPALIVCRESVKRNSCATTCTRAGGGGGAAIIGRAPGRANDAASGMTAAASMPSHCSSSDA